jgi:hypothetical protein
MEDFCILCTSPEQGQEIKAYIKSLGFDSAGLIFNRIGGYYGVKGNQTWFWPRAILVDASIIITLPEKPNYPCEMQVWSEEYDLKQTGKVIGMLNGLYICVSDNEFEKFVAGHPFKALPFKNAEPLPKLPELTIEEAEKKFGCKIRLV